MKIHLALALASSLAGIPAMAAGTSRAQRPVTAQTAARPDPQAQAKELSDGGKLDLAPAGKFHALVACNVRARPGTNSPITGFLSRGSSVTVLGRVPVSGWYAVSVDGTLGYMSGELLVADAPQAVATAPDPAASAPVPKPSSADVPAEDHGGEIPQPPSPVPAPESPAQKGAPTVPGLTRAPTETSMCPVPGLRKGT